MSDDWNTFSSPVAPPPSPAAPAPAAATGGGYDDFSSPAARSNQSTYQALERFVKAKFPNASFTSDYRDPTHNKSVGGVEGSYHTTGQAVDMTGLSDTERQQLKSDLTAAGVYPREFLFHNAGSGLHLHLAADRLPDAFVQQWGNHPAPNPTAAPSAAPGDPTATPEAPAVPSPEIIQAQKDATKLLQAGKEKEALELLGHHGLAVTPEELDAYHHGQRSNAFGEGVPTKGGTQGGTQHDFDYYGDQIRRGVGDLIDAPANVADLVYKGGQAIGRVASGGPLIGDVKDLPLPAIARPGQMANQAMDAAEQQDIGYLPEAANNPQRYAGAVTRLVAGSAIPAAKLASIGKARAALATLTGAATGGVTGEVAHDAAPLIGVDPDKARFFGQVAGSVAAGVPFGVKPLAEDRFVKQQVNKNPYAAYDAEIASELKGLTTDKAKTGVDPKGRAVVTATEINDLERSYTTGFQRKINALDIPDDAKRQLTDALLEDHSISTDDLDALRGTPEGDAVATGIIKAQRLRQLTPEVKRSGGMATARRVAEILGTLGGAVVGVHSGAPEISALTAPAGYGMVRLALRRGTEAEAARVHSAERVINKAPLYSRVADQVGPSGQIAAKQGLNDLYDGQVADQAAAKEQAASDKSDALQARADAAMKSRSAKSQLAAFNDASKKVADQKAADAKAARSNMTPAQHAAYIVREQAASDALKADPVLPPTPRGIQASLNKVQKASTVSSQKLSDFDTALETPKPAAPVKLSPEDLAIKNNMAQGLNGYHRAYADSISSHLGVDVQPADVLAALKKTDLSDVDPFQVQKFEMQHKVSPAAKAAILPRVEAVLRADKSVMERPVPEAPAKAPAAAAPKVAKAKPAAQPDAPAPAPSATPEPAPTAAPEADAPTTSGDYRRVVRKDLHSAGKARNQQAFDTQWDTIFSQESPHSKEIVKAAHDGIQHIRDGEKTTESAMRYFDEDLGPQLRKDNFHPQEIEDLRKDVDKMARAGKTYRTDAEFEKGAKVGPRGRPRSN